MPVLIFGVEVAVVNSEFAVAVASFFVASNFDASSIFFAAFAALVGLFVGFAIDLLPYYFFIQPPPTTSSLVSRS